MEYEFAPVETPPFSTLCPLAALLLLLHISVLGPRPEPTSKPIDDDLRCRKCHSPRTRIKGLACYPPTGLGPILGFTGRCRVCGAPNTYLVSTYCTPT